MSLRFQISPSFCVACFKSITTTIDAVSKNSEKIQKFNKFLTRLLGDGWAENKNLLQNNHVYITCEECNFTLDSFCELYHQIKCLELQLDLKLDKLMGIVKSSDRVTSKLTTVNKVLQLVFQDDIAKIEETQNEIKMIRQNIIKAGYQRLSKPRVLVNKTVMVTNRADSTIEEPSNSNTDKLTGFSIRGDRINVEFDDATTTIKTESYQVKQEYPQSPIPSIDTEFTVLTSDLALPILNTSFELINSNNIFPNVSEDEEEKTEEFSESQNDPLSDPLIETELEYPNIPKTEQHTKRSTLSKRHFEKQRVLYSKYFTIDYVEGVKYFLCKTCKTPFSNFGFLKRHLNGTACRLVNQEDGSESAKCFECNLTFDKIENLWVHQNQAHSSGKYNVCPKCGKSFNRTWTYKLHMEYHKGSANWKWECNKCKKKFATMHQLKRHEKSHTKEKVEMVDLEKAFPCETCGRKFRSKYGLRCHLSKVHGVDNKPQKAKIACQFCNARYTKRDSWLMHLKKIHGIWDGNRVTVEDINNLGYILPHKDSETTSNAM